MKGLKIARAGFQENLFSLILQVVGYGYKLLKYLKCQNYLDIILRFDERKKVKRKTLIDNPSRLSVILLKK